MFSGIKKPCGSVSLIKYGPLLGLCLLLLACDGRGLNFDPGDESDENEYKVVPVTPSVVSALQQRTFAEMRIDDANQPPKNDSPYEYKIGPGDIVNIKVWTPEVEYNRESGSVDSTAEWINYEDLEVRQDGTVTLPIIGDLHIVDKSILEASNTVDEAMSKYFKSWKTRIEVKEYNSRKILVIGEVTKPGEQLLTNLPLHLTEATSDAGGPTDLADLKHVALIHKDGTSEQLNMLAFINGSGNLSHNRILAEGDRLYFPTNKGNKIFILGEAVKPQIETIHNGYLTVVEALAASSGANPQTASYSHIYVLRGAINDPTLDATSLNNNNASPPAKAPAPTEVSLLKLNTTIFHLDMGTGTGMTLAAQFPLQPLDIVYVSPSQISQYGKFLDSILPGNIGGAVTGAAFYNSTNR